MKVDKYYNIDEKVVNQYLKDEVLMKLAAKWIMRDGTQTQAELKRIGDSVKKTQPFVFPDSLYRGITVGGFNNTHGIAKADFTKGNVLEIRLGMPTSFTDEIQVAEAFGKIVLETIDPINDQFIPIPQELSIAIQRRYKFNIPNMHEWICIDVKNPIKVVVKSLGKVPWYLKW